MNSRTIGLPNAAKAFSAGATPTSTASVGPSSAVTAIGSASLIHSVATTAITAVRRRPVLRHAGQRERVGQRRQPQRHPQCHQSSPRRARLASAILVHCGAV